MTTEEIKQLPSTIVPSIRSLAAIRKEHAERFKEATVLDVKSWVDRTHQVWKQNGCPPMCWSQTDAHDPAVHAAEHIATFTQHERIVRQLWGDACREAFALTEKGVFALAELRTIAVAIVYIQFVFLQHQNAPGFVKELVVIRPFHSMRKSEMWQALILLLEIADTPIDFIFSPAKDGISVVKHNSSSDDQSARDLQGRIWLGYLYQYIFNSDRRHLMAFIGVGQSLATPNVEREQVDVIKRSREFAYFKGASWLQ